MSTVRELVFDWLFNALVQIGLFAILAAALSPLIAKAKAQYQHFFYLAIFILCLTAPVFNTLWHIRPSVNTKGSQQQPIQATEHPGHNFWDWNGLPKRTSRSPSCRVRKLRSLSSGKCFFFIS